MHLNTFLAAIESLTRSQMTNFRLFQYLGSMSKLKEFADNNFKLKIEESYLIG